MVKKIALAIAAVLGVAVVVILGLASTKPDVMVIERSAVIKAPPEKLFAKVNNLHSWIEWSPYEALDPKVKRTFSGPDAGKGAVYAWDGNNDVGAGSMEITEITEPSNIKIDLRFLKPFKGDNKVNFSFVPVTEPAANGADANGTKANATKVSWTMSGESPLMCKVMQVFCNVDDMCGKDFEKGLAKLKTLAEG
ncbi:MAG: SRPBCC family protein [Candidatus Obscuribacterales bacterium]|jgi:hypothetical protein